MQHAEVTSTNDVGMELARAGAPAKTIVSADFQSAGRGRRGTPWVAPAGSSLLMSMVLRPRVTLPPSHLAILTGVGVAHALRALEAPVQIKWPNDILLQDRKVAGILVETTGDAVVVGIGVNCAIDAFPEELRERAGSLHALLGRDFPREEVLIAVARELSSALERVESGGILRVLYAWNTMNWYGRRRVRVSGPLGMVEGDGLFLDGRKIIWHVFKDAGVIAMPLNSTVEAI
jgi:BirA family biotin operon repressor/biotin-[acetyl-CoA-carboxylase] ligase